MDVEQQLKDYFQSAKWKKRCKVIDNLVDDISDRLEQRYCFEWDDIHSFVLHQLKLPFDKMVTMLLSPLDVLARNIEDFMEWKEVEDLEEAEELKALEKEKY